jgi:L-alanine-DL-glutamate epimerase-like enolase superfamily enzyme
VPPTPDPSAHALLAALSELPVTIEGVSGTLDEVEVPSYPGGRRPSAVVMLAGGGQRGVGEHVAWSMTDHRHLHHQLAAIVPHGRWTLGAWAAEVTRRTPRSYERAALEAAAIDLALRQHGTNLVQLAGARARPVRYVVSFEKRADPATEARRLLAPTPGIELKIDADPAWGDDVLRALAGLGSVAVLDFKGSGTAADHERAHRALPSALIEDPSPRAGPWSRGLESRISFDDPVRQAADVGTLPVRPAAVNVKPARLGGVLEALRCIAACLDAGIAVYMGGMFEVGVGRRQLHVLAALFSPDGPNDVAPLGVGGDSPARPRAVTVDVDDAGFGSYRA